MSYVKGQKCKNSGFQPNVRKGSAMTRSQGSKPRSRSKVKVIAQGQRLQGSRSKVVGHMAKVMGSRSKLLGKFLPHRLAEGARGADVITRNLG